MANGTGRAHWGSRIGFILAAAGSAVGLGNIWKFPYIAGEYGGGAFVLFYLLCVAIVGLPLMYAELIIGRRGGKDPLGALRALTEHRGAGSRALSLFTGGLAVMGGFLILSFYSVVAGWAIHFLFVAASAFEFFPGGALFEFVPGGASFEALVADWRLSSLWHTVFMVMTMVVVSRGVHNGIERVCSVLMPALIGILVVLLAYVGLQGGLSRSAEFLFRPDWSQLTGAGMLEALGHAFFTLSLGMGAMITYGSYLGSERNVVRDGVAVAVLDTAIALLAGLVIFAVVFAQGQDPGAGPGLVFVTLPDLFANMPGGTLFGIAFFFLLIFAAWSSAISLLEVVVTFFVDERGMKRTHATWGLGAVVWVLGLGSAVSGSFLGFLDDLTTRYMLPIGGLVIAIAAGWLLRREDREAGFLALGDRGRLLAGVWTVTIRFVTPVAVLLVILHQVGLLSFGG